GSSVGFELTTLEGMHPNSCLRDKVSPGGTDAECVFTSFCAAMYLFDCVYCFSPEYQDFEELLQHILTLILYMESNIVDTEELLPRGGASRSLILYDSLLPIHFNITLLALEAWEIGDAFKRCLSSPLLKEGFLSLKCADPFRLHMLKMVELSVCNLYEQVTRLTRRSRFKSLRPCTPTYLVVFDPPVDGLKESKPLP
ncbi:hypothetical protein Prudu_003357, partial [Prunus dulcis]